MGEVRLTELATSSGGSGTIVGHGGQPQSGRRCVALASWRDRDGSAVRKATPRAAVAPSMPFEVFTEPRRDHLPVLAPEGTRDEQCVSGDVGEGDAAVSLEQRERAPSVRWVAEGGG